MIVAQPHPSPTEGAQPNLRHNPACASSLVVAKSTRVGHALQRLDYCSGSGCNTPIIPALFPASLHQVQTLAGVDGAGQATERSALCRWNLRCAHDTRCRLRLYVVVRPRLSKEQKHPKSASALLDILSPPSLSNHDSW